LRRASVDDQYFETSTSLLLTPWKFQNLKAFCKSNEEFSAIRGKESIAIRFIEILTATQQGYFTMNMHVKQRLAELKAIFDSILKEKQEVEGDKNGASSTWTPNLKVMSYIHDLSPENLALIRLHTIHFTGM
jgi:hypothetical protein